MKPIPETAEAIDEFGPFSEVDLLQGLEDKAVQVRELVPEYVGLSLASLEYGVSFTLVATRDEIAALDGVQYLDGGHVSKASRPSECSHTQPKTYSTNRIGNYSLKPPRRQG